MVFTSTSCSLPCTPAEYDQERASIHCEKSMGWPSRASNALGVEASLGWTPPQKPEVFRSNTSQTRETKAVETDPSHSEQSTHWESSSRRAFSSQPLMAAAAASGIPETTRRVPTPVTGCVPFSKVMPF